jgi:hypothetical protein
MTIASFFEVQDAGQNLVEAAPLAASREEYHTGNAD